MDNKILYKNKCFVSIVVYLHNIDYDKIDLFFDKNINEFCNNFENIEVILVCDDEEAVDRKRIEDISKKYNNNISITIIKMAYYQGYEASMSAGNDLAIGDFVYEFDSVDIDYEPSLIMDIYNRAKTGYDIVSAGKNKMRLSSKLFYKLINHNSFYTLKHESFRIVSRRAINRIKMGSENIQYRKLVYATCGLSTDYIEYIPTNGSKNKKTKNETVYRFNAGINYMMMFTKTVERFTQVLTVLFLLASIMAGLWALYSYFNETNVAGGWVSLMGFISFGFFGVFLLLSFVIKYMTLMMEFTNKKMTYIVENVDKI